MKTGPLKVAICGAGGQVGRELVELLVNSPKFTAIALNSRALDIRNPQLVDSMVQQRNPDLVINAAAYTAVDRAEEEPTEAHAVNASGVANLSSACQRQSIPLFHISTDYVFDGQAEQAYREDDPVAPLGVYGESKLAGEQSLEGCDFINLRVSWVFGRYGQNFVKSMLHHGTEREQLKIVDDQRGGPTPAKAIADVLVNLAERYQNDGHLSWGTYHYSGAPDVSWHEFATTIFEYARHQGKVLKVQEVLPIPSSEYPTPAARPKSSAMDCQHIAQCLGIERPQWREYLQQVIAQLLHKPG